MKFYFWKLLFVNHPMPHADITLDPSHGDVFPCPTPNYEQTKHNMKKFSLFCINCLPPPSEPETGSSTWRHNSTEHIPIILK